MAKGDPSSSSHAEVVPVEGGLFGVRVVGITTVPAEKIYGAYKTRDLAQRIADRLKREMRGATSEITDGWVTWILQKIEPSVMNKNERYAHDLGFQAKQKFQSTNTKARRLGYAEIAMELWEFREWYFEKVRDVKACEWCDEPFGSGERQGGHVGHDHVTGECHFICQACNFIEGQARSPEHLERIAAAIRKARRSSS